MKKRVRFFTIILLFLTGLSATVGGGMLIHDSSGSSMKFPLDLLYQTPFNNYLIPGIILFFLSVFLVLLVQL